MDYMKFVEHHRSTNADITIGCLPVDYERASDFGLMKIDDEGRIFVRPRLRCLSPQPTQTPREGLMPPCVACTATGPPPACNA